MRGCLFMLSASIGGRCGVSRFVTWVAACCIVVFSAAGGRKPLESFFRFLSLSAIEQVYA